MRVNRFGCAKLVPRVKYAAGRRANVEECIADVILPTAVALAVILNIVAAWTVQPF